MTRCHARLTIVTVGSPVETCGHDNLCSASFPHGISDLNSAWFCVDSLLPPLAYSVTFNASSLSSGVYFYRIQSGSFAAVKKMMLLK